MGEALQCVGKARFKLPFFSPFASRTILLLE